MKVVVIAAETFGYRCLQRLLSMGIRVEAVFPMGREVFFRKVGIGMAPSHYKSFARLANEYSAPVFYVDNINDECDVQRLRDIRPDLIAVFAWSRMIKRPILDIPQKGVIGFHDSLLPKRRGRAPINWAIIDGLTRTGQTLFYYNEEADAGDIIAQRVIPIEFEDTCQTLSEKGTEAALDMLTHYVPMLAKGSSPRTPQDHSQATTTPRRRPEDGLIDWRLGSVRIYNLVRGVTKPFPGAFTYWRGEKMTIWKCVPYDTSDLETGLPGEVLEVPDNGGPIVGTGDGALQMLDVRFREKDQPAASFVRKYGLRPSARFSASALATS